MKKKWLTYFLIAGVTLVWGIIIMRILKATSQDKTNEKIRQTSLSHVDYSHVIESSDTQTLKFNYQDPFLKNDPVHNSLNKIAHADVNIHTKPVAAKVDVGFLTYHGYILSQDGKRKVLLLTIHGKDEMATVGQSLNKIRFVKADASQINILYQGMKFTVTKK